jgi:hypothetical protein
LFLRNKFKRVIIINKKLYCLYIKFSFSIIYMPRKHHSKRRHHRRSQRGGGWFDGSSTQSSTGSDSGWFSGITNKAKGLTSSISSWFGSSSPSSSSAASGYQSPPQQYGQQPQYGQQGQYAGRKRRTRKLGRDSKSKKRRGGVPIL